MTRCEARERPAAVSAEAYRRLKRFADGIRGAQHLVGAADVVLDPEIVAGPLRNGHARPDQLADFIDAAQREPRDGPVIEQKCWTLVAYAYAGCHIDAGKPFRRNLPELETKAAQHMIAKRDRALNAVGYVIRE